MLVRKDDGGRPEDTVSFTKELLAQAKPLVLSGYFGNNSISALHASNILQQERIALIGYRSSELRADTPYVYNVRAGLRDEINKLTEHLATIGITRLGLFYEGGYNTSNLLAATDEATKKAKAQIIVQATYQSGANNTGKAADEFLKAQPQAILLITSGAAAASFIEQYRAIGGSAQNFSHSGADIEQRFMAAKVIVEAVRRQGRSPTREGTAAVLDAMGNYDVGG